MSASAPPSGEDQDQNQVQDLAHAGHRIDAGCAAFNRAQYFEAHESWEDAWRVAVGAPRTVMQGLIQIAAGLHHLGQGRRGPATRLLVRGLRRLRSGIADLVEARADREAPAAPAAVRLAELDLTAFVAETARLLEALQACAGGDANAAVEAPRLTFELRL